ncbi:lysine--tRNA ligase [Patescibacteria group bacterium]|nr:lysine--tRNA ligase [Patescibacteria group bacterium]
MTSLDEIRAVRLAKLKTLDKSGMISYPIETAISTLLSEARGKFSFLKGKRKPITLVGRIVSLRGHGGSLFCDLSDGKHKFQIYLKRDSLGKDAYSLFESTVDVGDFCEFQGKLFLTKKREKTLEAASWKMLAKSLRPLPEKWHGLLDVEERFRRRYLDLLSNSEVRERFEVRMKILSLLRNFLEKAGFEHVETPLLHPIAGGAAARPFLTHHHALDMDLYLRVAPELYLKRLLVGGFGKIYEIGRSFRNEGIDATHNPEFTTLELYEAFSDAARHRDFVEKMLRVLVKALKKSQKFTYQENAISFEKAFNTITFEEGLSRFALVNNYTALSDSDLALKAKQVGIEIEKGDRKAKIADKIFAKICRPKLIQPTFVLYYPRELVPLAKEYPRRPGFADRYQLVIGGLEIANGFSELNDPIEQRERFLKQEAMREAGDEEAGRLDEDFLEALEYGMPPAAGLGIGIDRLVMLLTDVSNIREVIFFPTLRPRQSD